MKKKIYAILIALIAIASINVYAKTDRAFYADETVSVKKEINTTSFVAGNNVDVSSTVDGLNFIAGNVVNVSSTQDYAFVAGNIVTLTNVTSKDAFVAGSLIKVIDSDIRDLYAVAETITINSNISRNLYAAGENITINSTIDGDVNLSAEKITIGENAVITGKLTYNENADIDIDKSASVESTKTYKPSENVDVEVEVSPVALIVAEITSKIMSYLSMLAISLLLMVLNKKVFKDIKKIDKDAGNLVKTGLFGFAFLVGLPVAAVILLITVIGLPISIISLLLYGILIYLSLTATTYFFGSWLLKDKIKNEYLQFTITLLAIYVLKMIPIIGGLVGFISLCLGLGIYVTLFSKYIKSNK